MWFWQGIGRSAKSRVKAGKLGRAYRNARAGVGRTLGGKGASGMAGLGSAATGIAKFAGPVGVAVAAADALNEFRKAVIRATDAQIAAAQRLADVSGPMAAVFAGREVSELKRDIRRGQATAESTGKLVEAEQKRKDASLPFENAMTNLENHLLAWGNEAIAAVLDVGNKILRLMPEKKEDPEGLGALGPLVEAETRRLDARAEAMMEAARRYSPTRGEARPGEGAP